MKKLLHERLRKIDNPVRIKTEQGVLVALYQSEAQALADEIERYYIPRPRDNMGIPYIEGDTVWSTDPETEYNATVSEVRMDEVIIRWEDGIISRCKPFDLQHDRPQPKVIDADGVEIKVGDAVWSVNSGTKYRIYKLYEDGAVDVTYPEDDIPHGGFDADKLTHKEPDSLEKLRDDMVAWNDLRMKTFCADWINRLSALIEKGDK